jgi:predicted GH43/DUF377 family glycosyl hydrolase
MHGSTALIQKSLLGNLDFLFFGSTFLGRIQLIMRPVPYHWDEMKIGPGAPPIKTEEGWLSIYHGVFKTMDGSVYRLGVALHELQNPGKIIGVGDSWILQPEDPWEVTGYVHNVVSPVVRLRSLMAP